MSMSSCQNCVCIPSDGLRLAMISFDSADIDTLILRKFAKGSGFSHMIDTVQWDRSKVVFSVRNDTFQMGAFVGGILPQSKFDYQVFLPAPNRTFSITEINESQSEGNCNGKVMCVNSIVSCKLEGNATTISYDILYLKK